MVEETGSIIGFVFNGLCFSSAWGPQAPNCCLWVTRKNLIFCIKLKSWAPQISWLAVIALRAQPWIMPLIGKLKGQLVCPLCFVVSLDMRPLHIQPVVILIHPAVLP